MPLFFLLSGYLMRVENISFGRFAMKKFRSLIVPYAFFVVISFVFWYFAGRKFGDDIVVGYDTGKYIAGIFLAVPSKEFLGFNLPLWFLPSLFIAGICLFQINKMDKRLVFPIVIACFTLGIILRENDFIRLPWGMDVCLFSLFFIQTGKLLRNSNLTEKYLIQIHWFYKIVISAACFVICAYVSHINGKTYMYNCQFNNYLLFLVTAFSGSFFLLYFSCLVPKIGLFDFFGRNTLVIMALHLLCFSFLKGTQVFALHIPLTVIDGNLPLCILYAMMAFVLLAPVIWLINKYLPELLGRKRV
jgi:fucose 4-O-acetylase-like acetyltransferase